MTLPQKHLSRVEIVDTLRGVASLMVCWFHITHNLASNDIISRYTDFFAEFGVSMFFALSGFVIPYSLDRSHYTPSAGLLRFVAKRVVRLDPPYFASILLAILVTFSANLTPGYQGAPLNFSWTRLFLHAGYLNGLAGVPWFNGVYWTLALEFQFYLLVALIFPALADKRPWIRRTTIATLCAIATVAPSTNSTLFQYLALFATGMLAFHLRTARISVLEFLISQIFVVLSAHASNSILVGAAVSGCIAFLKLPPLPAAGFFATISYSLYLIHVPIGRSLVHLGERLLPDQQLARLGLSIGVFAICIGCAFVFYMLFERPAHRMSARINYRAQRPASMARQEVLSPTEA